MGCSTSKSKVNGIKDENSHSTTKIQVEENEQRENISNTGKPSVNVDTENKKKVSSHQSISSNNNNVADEAKSINEEKEEESKAVTFVKREETEESAERDAVKLHDIFDGSENINVKEALRILGPVDYDYRQTTRKKFKEKFNQDLLDKVFLRDDRHLESAVQNLIRNEVECLSHYMQQSVKGNQLKMLVEVLTAWPPDIVSQAKLLYEQDRRVSLNDDIINSVSDKMSEESKLILTSLSLLQRDDESKEVSEAISSEECEELSESGRAIIDILASKPYSRKQLTSIFDQFKAKYYLDIAESIEIEFQDETEVMLKAIVGMAVDITGYFAKQLHEVFSKPSINKDRLAFIIISRHPIDLLHIVEIYERLTTGSLIEDIGKHLNGDLKDLLGLIVNRTKVN